MPGDHLQFVSLTKTFPGVRALDDVSFGVRQGSVHALLGENGAGKSTLLHALSGAGRPDSGSITLDGNTATPKDTDDAIRAGIAVIYQEPHLAPDLTVAENLFLGHLPNTRGWVNRRRLYADAARMLEDVGEAIPLRAKVSTLSPAQRQMLEIAKALSRDAKVIAFDEPTSSLSEAESKRLFAIIARLKAQGRVVLYVSHRMAEIFQVCDAATVLRDGRHIATHESLEGVTEDQLVHEMIGRSIEDIYHYEPRERGDLVLSVNNLTGPGLAEPVSFEVRAGEVFGLFGLVGAGRSELAALIGGSVKPAAGQVQVNGDTLRLRHPKDAIRAGVVTCPEDRKKQGVIPGRSVAENINISTRRHHLRFGQFLDSAFERTNAAEFIAKLDIKTPTPRQHADKLSGGNQQKVILGRWLGERLSAVLLDEPTRGIDVGAKSEIYRIIFSMANRGIAVVVISSELPEVLGISDRIGVMRQGRLVAQLTRDQATPKRVLQLALPITEATVQTETNA